MPTFFTLEKIQKQLVDIRAARLRAALPIPSFKFHEGDLSGAERPAFDDTAWADFRTGDAWGGYDVTAWFRARVPVPADWRGHQLALHFQVGPRDGGDGTAESMLYLGGEPLQALDTWHEEAWLLPEHLEGGRARHRHQGLERRVSHPRPAPLRAGAVSLDRPGRAPPGAPAGRAAAGRPRAGRQRPAPGEAGGGAQPGRAPD